MANTIPRARKRAYANTLAAKTLYAAFFVDVTGYSFLTSTTYTDLIGEVSHASYTTGGYLLAGVAASDLAGNGAKVTANAMSVASATFIFRYIVIYDRATDTIEGVIDLGGDQTVNGGTVSITFDATNGLFNIQ